ncbi:peptidylprolyl isomerase [Lacticaseibacillus camelliae]|uniref:Foldase protein PrsA n=1 Tax=Lacticaseibacillus camelliae DSM 22697 = JCM 13995 TaxID=1423730 RepID=A0A0R2F9A4_9LACO|nr:peptidylprolyl isomerase [Lacticaseibacillus camelliae]KRN24911.1 peptidylprolyl isomerase [Lacticaseibacillus camelliae DSM 22697 = JCM 13995]
MKKWIAGIAGVLLALTLAGCSSDNATVANMKGAKITKDEYYNEMKTSSSGGEDTLRNMIVTKALEQQYPKAGTDKQVDKQYNKVKKSYTDAGQDFDSALAQSNLTTKSFKDQIKTSLLSEAALKDLKKPTQKQLDNQWKKYEPKITVQHILVAKESTANEVLAALKKDNSAANFKTLAKKYSTDTATASNAGKLPAFDNTDTSLDSTFKAAAFKLKKAGDYTTTPVKTSYGYHIIRAVKIPKKGSEQSHKKELTDQLYTSWESDSTVMNGIIKKVLTKADVSIKDNDLKNVLSVYLGSSSSAK